MIVDLAGSFTFDREEKMKGSESSQVLAAEVWTGNPSGGAFLLRELRWVAVSTRPGLLAPGPPGQAVAAGLSERAASDRPLAAPLTICPRTTRSKSCAGHSLPLGKGLLEGGGAFSRGPVLRCQEVPGG